MEEIELSYPGKKSRKSIIDASLTSTKIRLPQDKSILIYGDNFEALGKLLSSGFNKSIDLIYIDPPFNTSQTFTVTESRISTISRNGTDVAYNDDLSPSEYLEFIRERLILLRELLSDEGSIYVHIDCKMGHYLKIIMDEVFGSSNFLNDIARIKSNPKNFKRPAYGNQRDMILFYAKKRGSNIFNNITISLSEEEKRDKFKKIDHNGRRYNTVPVHAPGETVNGDTGGYWKGMLPPKGRHWRTNPKELDKLDKEGLIEWSKNGVPRIIKYADDHKGKKIQDVWRFIDPSYPTYPTEKNLEMLKTIVLQSSKKSSYVLDAFAGSGSTLLAAQLSDRKWIGIDQSEYSIKAIQKRMEKYEYEFINCQAKKLSA